jgi:hypothetical protein
LLAALGRREDCGQVTRAPVRTEAIRKFRDHDVRREECRESLARGARFDGGNVSAGVIQVRGF